MILHQNRLDLFHSNEDVFVATPGSRCKFLAWSEASVRGERASKV